MTGKPIQECTICDQRITAETDSREHIIPNALGGKEKVSGFICKTCNSETGDSWDAELAQQMNPLSLFFRISRDRGVVPSQAFSTASGKQWVLNSDGTISFPKPQFTKKNTVEGIEVNILARDMREARKMLEGLAREYPKIDVEQLLQETESQSNYAQEPINFDLSLGGSNAGRSIVKSALALISTCGINARECEHAIDFLNDEESEPCFGYYNERDLVVNRPEGVPLHCVHVNGAPDQGIIRGYVEYFGFFRVVMCLSSSYSGDGFSRTYAIDPVRREELDIDIALDLTKDEIEKAYGYEKFDAAANQAALGAVIGPAVRRHHEEEKHRVIQEAAEYAFENCGAREGELLTDEHRNRLVGLMWEKLEPWLINNLATKRRRS